MAHFSVADLHQAPTGVERDPSHGEAQGAEGAHLADPHLPPGQLAGEGVFITQGCKDPAGCPYDETGPHGFRVAEHRLGGDEDP